MSSAPRSEELEPAGGASDERLVGRVLEDDREAFDALIRRHESEVTRKIAMILRGQEGVDDATQRTWIRAYQRIRGLREPAQFRAWVMQIARNEALGVLRKRKRRREVGLEAAIGELRPTKDIEDQVSQRAMLRLTSGWIREMSDLDQRLFFHAVVEGLTMEEIGGLVGMSEGGVKARLFRAREVLRSERSRRAA